MSGLEINIDAEAVEKAVVQAVIDSALGAKLQEIISAHVAEMSNTWRESVLKKALEAEVQRIVLEVLRSDEHAPRIRAAVQARLTDAVVDDVAVGAWNALMSKANL